MKILLFGKKGQLGWELQRSLAPLGIVVALCRDSLDFCGDFTNPEGLADTVRRLKPDVIVNAAAHTAVDKAESEVELAQIVNVDSSNVLAREARLLNAWLIHYSTDYVFDGGGAIAWVETDTPKPLSVYGATKLAGEEAIRQSACKHLIFRASWVYGTRGHNFAKTMLRLAQERDDLSVIDDQVGAPTGADLLADITAHAIRSVQLRPELSGLYHLAAAGETSWYGYARFVLEFASKMGINLKVAPEAIKAVPTSAFPTPAQRPKNSRLDTGKFQKNFNMNLPHWQAGVARMITEILEEQ